MHVSVRPYGQGFQSRTSSICPAPKISIHKSAELLFVYEHQDLKTCEVESCGTVASVYSDSEPQGIWIACGVRRLLLAQVERETILEALIPGLRISLRTS